MVFIILWIALAAPIGLAFAYVEGKVNSQRPRWLNCVLWSVCTGFIGWIVIAMRSGLTHTSKRNEARNLQAEVARRQLAEMDERRDRAAGS